MGKLKKSGIPNFFVSLIALTLLILISSCQTTGKSIAGIQPGENFRAERSANGNTITIELAYPPSLQDSEVVVIAEKTAEGLAVIDGSISPSPDFKTGSLMVWLFSKGADQSLGTFQITRRIPPMISYQVQGTPVSGSAFKGKWGLKNAALEGEILSPASSANQGSGSTGTGGSGSGAGNTGSGDSSAGQGTAGSGTSAMGALN
ncbi:hypothetical protein HYU13_04520 [Candidatus Woesearchaeota archaeon]|nr:hypothetical protein [Candidatus Woesearchaeota archaeon]